MIESEPVLLAPRDEGGRAGLVADAFGQILGDEVAALGEGDGALDRVLQFPRISRPLVGGENGERLRGDVERGPPGLLGDLVDEVLDQQRNVEGALAQRRYMDPDLTMRPGAIAMAVLLSVLTTGLVWLYLKLAQRWSGIERPLFF